MQKYVDEGLYIYGAMIGHNMAPATPGKGSCFFIHVWRTPDTPTNGCTAMEKNNTKKIMMANKPLIK